MVDLRLSRELVANLDDPFAPMAHGVSLLCRMPVPLAVPVPIFVPVRRHAVEPPGRPQRSSALGEGPDPGDHGVVTFYDELTTGLSKVTTTTSSTRSGCR